jgi:anti-sigma-K factor RskA
MIDERHEELAALYALDLLEGAEKSEFETALARDAALQALVRELRESSTALAHATPGAQPPPALKKRLLAALEARGRPAAGDKMISFPRWIPWAAAACFALLAAWSGQLFLTARSEADALRAQQALADASLKSLENRLEAERIIARQQVASFKQQSEDAAWQLTEARRATEETRQLSAEVSWKTANAERLLAATRAELAELGRQLKAQGDVANLKITTLASMLNNSPQALAVAVWNPANQEGVLTVEKLPALAADKDYQLWVMDPQYPAPIDGGVFTVDPRTGEARVKFWARQPVNAIAAFAVTVERKGGVAKSEGQPVLLGKSSSR